MSPSIRFLSLLIGPSPEPGSDRPVRGSGSPCARRRAHFRYAPGSLSNRSRYVDRDSCACRRNQTCRPGGFTGCGSRAPPAAPAATPAAAAPKSSKAKSANGGASKTGAKAQPGVVITVGPNKIRKRQIDTLVQLMVKVKQAPENMDPREKQYLERMVATNLIGQELLDLEAKRLNVVADDKSIDSLAQVFKTNFPNDEAFRRALKEAGDSEKGLREKMIRQIKADKLLNAQMAPVSRPTPKEMQDFFAAHKSAFPINDSLRACQILFMVEKNAGSGGSRQAQGRSGKDPRGNRQGQRPAGNAPDPLRDARPATFPTAPKRRMAAICSASSPGISIPNSRSRLSTLKVGQMSPVFRTPLGWHLVLLTERNDGKFESYQLQVARALVQEKSAKAGKNLKKYLQTLADRYKVSYLENAYRDTSLAGVYEP